LSRDVTCEINWWLHQVKTRAFATNPYLMQYWHSVKEKPGLVEHWALESLDPVKWSIFKRPYDFIWLDRRISVVDNSACRPHAKYAIRPAAG
jgi:hypothetical protein